MNATSEDMTFFTYTSWQAINAAVHHLGFTSYDAGKPSTWTLETEVLVQTLRAYDQLRSTGYFTRGGVPKPKTNKQGEIDLAVFVTLLDIAHNYVLPWKNSNRSKTEDAIREAWQAGIKAAS